jgi:drug/metabolite transporter (DMT)-like permease
MSPTKDFLRLHLLVFLWGFTAILGALITIPSVEIVFYRTLLASAGLWLVLYIRKIGFRMPRHSLIKILGTGALIAAHWILFFGAARVANVSVCLAGMATCSLWTSILEPLITKRPFRAFELVLGALGFVGLWVIFQFNFEYKLGIAMAVLSAFLSALFTVLNGRFIRSHNAYTITYYEMIGAWLATAAFLPFYGKYIMDGVQLIPASIDWVYLLILAMVCTVFAYSESVELMKRLSAFIVNLTVNLEPVYGIIAALILFPEKEKMPGNFYLGTAIILLSVLIYPLLNRIYGKKPLGVDNLR